ncbi:ABC transporter substrate-binding protein [Micromonospora sp. NPDC004336]
MMSELVVLPMLREPVGSSGLRRAAAESVESPDGGRTWIVRLGRDLFWSDGVRLDAAHAARSVRAVALRRGWSVGNLLAPEPVRVLAPDTVSIALRRRCTYFPALLTLPQFAPSRRLDDASRTTLGMYVSAGSADPAVIRLVRNERHDAACLPREVRAEVCPDLATSLGHFAIGRSDMTPTTGFSPADVESLRGHPALHRQPIAVYASLEFGRGLPAVRADARVRRALAAALDPVELIAGTAGLLVPAPVPARTMLDGATASTRWPGIAAGPDRAEISLVRAALGPIVEFCFADFPPNDVSVAILARQLNDAFGITVTPRSLSYDDYVAAARSGSYQLLYTLTTADYPHPSALLEPWTSGGAAAREVGLRDAELDGLVAIAAASGPEAEGEAWAEAENRWLTQLPRIPLAQVMAHYLARPCLGALGLTTGGLLPLDLLAAETLSQKESHATV